MADNRWHLAFEVDDKHVQHVLAMLELKLSPSGLTGFMYSHVDPFIRARTASRFAGEGDDVTGAWHPLAKATELIRASKGFTPSHPINERTARLKSVLVGRPGDAKPNGFGATLTYPGPIGDASFWEKMSTAQGGSDNPPTPPRPVIGFNENDMLFVTTELVAWLSEDYI